MKYRVHGHAKKRETKQRINLQGRDLSYILRLLFTALEIQLNKMFDDVAATRGNTGGADFHNLW